MLVAELREWRVGRVILAFVGREFFWCTDDQIVWHAVAQRTGVAHRVASVCVCVCVYIWAGLDVTLYYIRFSGYYTRFVAPNFTPHLTPADITHRGKIRRLN